MLTIAEVEKDLADSARGLEALQSVVFGLRDFINNPCGENRTHLHSDLYKWEGMQTVATRLHAKIEGKLAELKGAQN